MPKTTFTVTAPTGQVLTRTSENRTYTHAIIGRPSYARAMANARIISKTDKENHEFHVAMANGTHELAQRRTWQTEENHAKEIAGYKLEAAQAVSAAAYAELKRDQRVAAVETLKADGHFDRFVAITWTGRPDLAQKELSKAASGGYYQDLAAVPVTVKGR